MAVQSTLAAFGVPLGSGTGRGGILQPKRKNIYRFRVFNFGAIGGGLELSQQVATMGRPEFTQDPVAVHSYNSTAYYTGKAVWGTISVTIRDDVTNSATSLIGYQLQKQMNVFEQTTPLAGSNYKFQCYAEMLDGGNDNVLEQWYGEGCFLSSIAYGDFDYSTSEAVMITLTIRADNWTQQGGVLMPDPVTTLTGPNL